MPDGPGRMLPVLNGGARPASSVLERTAAAGRCASPPGADAGIIVEARFRTLIRVSNTSECLRR